MDNLKKPTTRGRDERGPVGDPRLDTTFWRTQEVGKSCNNCRRQEERTYRWMTVLLFIPLFIMYYLSSSRLLNYEWGVKRVWVPGGYGVEPRRVATERTYFARYIQHYTQFVTSPVHSYQIQRAVHGLLYRLLPAIIPFLVGPSEETEVKKKGSRSSATSLVCTSLNMRCLLISCTLVHLLPQYPQTL
jgi:hypothetical protein